MKYRIKAIDEVTYNNMNRKMRGEPLIEQSQGGPIIEYDLRPADEQSFGVTFMSFYKDRPRGKEFYCPNCGTWYTNIINSRYYETSRSSIDRIELMHKVRKTCLYCNHKLLGGWEACEYILNENENKKKEIDSYIDKIKEECALPIITVEKDFSIKEYFKHLVNIETILRFLATRYKNLTEEQLEIRKYALKEKEFFKNQEVERIDKCIEKEKKEMEKAKPKCVSEKINPAEIGLIKPQEPKYEKAGLFNKKKITEKNEQIKSNYEKEMIKYKECLSQKEEERRKQNIEIKRKISEVTIYYNSIIDGLKKEKEEILESLDSKEGKYTTINSVYESEIEEIKEKIEEVCKARAELLKINVIHPKYLDFVALTTISEYFDTGRCQTLEGRDGAYNLYEQEKRDNLILTQIDKIIESLEEVKNNQNKAYHILISMENEISKISKKMDAAIEVLGQINKNTKEIQESSKVTEYYAEKTAQYSKIHTELLEAIGFMAAFG